MRTKISRLHKLKGVVKVVKRNGKVLAIRLKP